jgi:hypothetical protein
MLLTLLLSLALTSPTHAADRPFKCEADQANYHFEAVGTVGANGLTGEVTGNVFKDGKFFTSAHSNPATSSFADKQKLDFTAKSLLVQVSVESSYAGAAGYTGVMTVHSLFFGNAEPMKTTCTVQ